MDHTGTSSSGGFKIILLYRRMIFAGVFMLVLVTSAHGQGPAPNPGFRDKQNHWHKYVNHQYGFSFWYADPYGPVPLPEPDDHGSYYREHEKGLLLLHRRDNPDAKIWINIDLQPFHLGLDAGSNIPHGQQIGHHIFYYYGPGGGGVDYSYDYLVKIKGKALRFSFDGPYDKGNTPDIEPQLVSKMLKTLRTF